MERTTYRSILRSYSDGIAGGGFDSDVTDKRTRFYFARLLNLASNSGHADYPYPPTEAQRDGVAKHLGAIVWDARALITDRDSDKFEAALSRAIEVVRNA